MNNKNIFDPLIFSLELKTSTIVHIIKGNLFLIYNKRTFGQIRIFMVGIALNKKGVSFILSDGFGFVHRDIIGKWRIALAKISLIVLCFISSTAISQDCGGKFRWGIKVISDTSKINRKYIKSSIFELSKLKPEVPIKIATPRLKDEKYIYSIRCRIKSYKLEEDGDYHLVICDPLDPSITMVAEIPNPLCVTVQQSRYILSIQKVREFFLFKIKGNPSAILDTYEITGIFYFDLPHYAKGCANNYGEIHPVLSIKKVQ